MFTIPVSLLPILFGHPFFHFQAAQFAVFPHAPEDFFLHHLFVPLLIRHFHRGVHATDPASRIDTAADRPRSQAACSAHSESVYGLREGERRSFPTLIPSEKASRTDATLASSFSMIAFSEITPF